MKNVVFMDLKTLFVPHRRHISATPPSELSNVRYEVFTAVTMRNAVI
jgi:hypothetical protein